MEVARERERGERSTGTELTPRVNCQCESNLHFRRIQTNQDASVLDHQGSIKYRAFKLQGRPRADRLIRVTGSTRNCRRRRSSGGVVSGVCVLGRSYILIGWNPTPNSEGGRGLESRGRGDVCTSKGVGGQWVSRRRFDAPSWGYAHLFWRPTFALLGRARCCAWSNPVPRWDPILKASILTRDGRAHRWHPNPTRRTRHAVWSVRQINEPLEPSGPKRITRIPDYP